MASFQFGPSRVRKAHGKNYEWNGWHDNQQANSILAEVISINLREELLNDVDI